MNKVIFEKEYGWGDLYDLERDVADALDRAEALDDYWISGEYPGVMKVTIEYIDECLGEDE